MTLAVLISALGVPYVLTLPLSPPKQLVLLKMIQIDIAVVATIITPINSVASQELTKNRMPYSVLDQPKIEAFNAQSQALVR